jgi:hypothetical protein
LSMNSARTTIISRINILAFYRPIKFGYKQTPGEAPIIAKVANVLSGA